MTLAELKEKQKNMNIKHTNGMIGIILDNLIRICVRTVWIYCLAYLLADAGLIVTGVTLWQALLIHFTLSFVSGYFTVNLVELVTNRIKMMLYKYEEKDIEEKITKAEEAVLKC